MSFAKSWYDFKGKGVDGSESIKWNLTKSLVDEHGQVLKRYAPVDKPKVIEADVTAVLEAP